MIQKCRKIPKILIQKKMSKSLEFILIQHKNMMANLKFNKFKPIIKWKIFLSKDKVLIVLIIHKEKLKLKSMYQSNQKRKSKIILTIILFL